MSSTLKSIWKAQAKQILAVAEEFSDEEALKHLGKMLRKFDTMKNRGSTIISELKKAIITRMVKVGVWEYFASRRNFVKLVYKPSIPAGSDGAEKVNKLAELVGVDIARKIIATSIRWVDPQPGGMTSVYTVDIDAVRGLPPEDQLKVFEVLGWPELHVEDPPKRAKAGKERRR